MTSLSTVVSSAGEELAAGVPTGGSGLGAGEPHAGLAAGTEPVQGEGAGRTGAGVTDLVTGVVATAQQLPTRSAALVLWAGAGPGPPGLATGAALYAALVTRPAVPAMADVPTLMFPAAQSLLALAATAPGGGVTPADLGPAVTTVAGGAHRHCTGGTGARVTQQQALVATPSERPPTQLPTAVRSHPGIKLRLPLLSAVTMVLLGDLTGGLASPALGTGPADGLLLLCPVRVIL